MAHCLSPTLLLYLIALLASALGVVNNASDLLDVRVTLPGDGAIPAEGSDKCGVQLHNSLEKLRKRQNSQKIASLIDLSGYALHQALRNAPVDMYVTDIKVRAPSVGSWVQVQKCQFSRQAEMKTQLLFNDLLVSGIVRLLPGDLPHGAGHQAQEPPEHCTMTLRLRRAALDLKAAPDLGLGPKIATSAKGIQVRTESNFIDPHFLSVHAYGCKLDQWARDGWFHSLGNYGLYSDYGGNRRSGRSSDDAEIRIISLGQEPELNDDMDNEFYRQRILGYGSASEKLSAVFNIKKQIQQQANALFQTHGPFSQQITVSNKPKLPVQEPPNFKPTSTITELDDTLRPIRPISHQPFQAFLASTTSQPPQHRPPVYGPPPTPPLHDVSSEMEDVFLRGTKALLAKYLEKQLEVPLKEALMTKIGYTVSYG